jgi:hypothetical protein
MGAEQLITGDGLGPRYQRPGAHADKWFGEMLAETMEMRSIPFQSATGEDIVSVFFSLPVFYSGCDAAGDSDKEQGKKYRSMIESSLRVAGRVTSQPSWLR